MFKILVIHNFFIIAVLSGFSSTAIAASFAATNDYDWVVMETPKDSTSYKYDCNHDYKYETHTALQNCLHNLREDADNAFSKQWGIDDRVVRERNAIYIEVPNRKKPLVFVDYSSPFETDFNAYYSLEDYDKLRQLLTIHQILYESETLTVVNLVTGFWQDFELRKLSISPDMRYIVGFESEPGITEDIAIWERQQEGYYRGYYKRAYSSDADADIFKSRKEFYQVKERQFVYDAETITWIDENQFHADYFYKLNEKDSAAFRVRYTFKRDSSTDKWQLLKGDVH